MRIVRCRGGVRINGKITRVMHFRVHSPRGADASRREF